MRRALAAAVAMMVAGAAIGAGRAQADGALQTMRAPEGLRATEEPGAPKSPQTPPGRQTAGQDAKNGQAATSHGQHYVTVKFNYNFWRTPACSAKVKTACVQEFVAYDISGGAKNRLKLFEIPLPANTKGVVLGITGKSPQKLDFESGKHLISVVAREPDGSESKAEACTIWIVIP